MKSVIFAFVLASVALWSAPQDIQFPASFDRLAEKAEDVVDITLDSSMLGLASGFMSDTDPEQKEAKEIVKGLNGIYIRSFEFAEEGQYSAQDLEDVRSQLKAPEWTPIVNVRSQKKGSENAQIFLRKSNGKISGLTVLAAEPKSLTIVHIVGTIDPEQVGRLSGQFGIPRMQMEREEESEKK